MRPLTLFILVAAACDSNRFDTEFVVDTDITDTDVDEDCPEIDHDAIEESQPYNTDIEVTATITDDSGVILVAEVYYKKETDTSYTSIAMQGSDEGGEFVGVIPGEDVAGGGMDYYLLAVDGSNNECTDPTQGPNDPYHFRVSAD